MAQRRPPEAPVIADQAPPPNWLAREVWRHRWQYRHMGPLPENYSASWRTVYNASPLTPALERALGRWEAMDNDERAKWWQHDDNRPGQEAQQCKHHDQPVAFCDADCSSVARIQREYDAEHDHQWRKNP